MKSGLLLPMALMVGLTTVVVAALGLVRLLAVRGGRVRYSYFKTLPSGTEVPPRLAQIARNVSNLFELPVLFYVACLAGMILVPQGDEALVVLAYTYAALRAGHSLIHCTYNDVTQRFGVWLLSCCALLGLWGRLVYLAA